MADEEYEILPHQLLSDLKYDVEALKKKLTQPDAKINELILEIESMKDSIHDLNTIFQKALEETKGEDVSKTINDLNKKITDVMGQNEIIAKGMIAISDKLEEFIGKQPHPGPEPRSPKVTPAAGPNVQHTMGPPSMAGPRFAPPPVPSREGQADVSFPPPPPGLPAGKKKRGLFK